MRGKCDFCGRGEREVALLISGASAHICDDCVMQAYRVVVEQGIADGRGPRQGRGGKSAGHKQKKVPKPQQIKAFLDQYVIGQDEAKKFLSVAVYNHYKRLEQGDAAGRVDTRSTPTSLAAGGRQGDAAGRVDTRSTPTFPDGQRGDAGGAYDDVEIEKSNILMVGATGTGKTLLARTIARLLDVPFTIVDATVFTEAGYVGEDVESILSRLLQVADYDVEWAEKGIVFIDEIDKTAKAVDNPSITRDVGGEGVQQSMLKLLEGTDVNVPPKGGRKHPDQDYVKVNTRNILFICGGAFDGIERRIAQRLNTHVVGYGAVEQSRRVDRENIMKYIQPQDLKAFGLIPELIGRLPVLTHLDSLDRDALMRILTEPRNSIIRQYEKLFRLDGIELSFSEDALSLIVDKAMEYRLGARGLRSIVESIMVDAMFEMPSGRKKSLAISRDYALGKIEKGNLEKLRA